MQHINNAFSSYFIVIYDGVLYFFGGNVFLGDCSQNQVSLHSVGHVVV